MHRIHREKEMPCSPKLALIDLAVDTQNKKSEIVLQYTEKKFEQIQRVRSEKIGGQPKDLLNWGARLDMHNAKCCDCIYR